MIARRIVDLIPKLSNIKVRRTSRLLYPMTPDGALFVGWSRELEGNVHGCGLCGQGYMLVPGVGALVSHLLLEELLPGDRQVSRTFRLRAFKGEEALK